MVAEEEGEEEGKEEEEEEEIMVDEGAQRAKKPCRAYYLVVM